jgi:hypothetical protein
VRDRISLDEHELVAEFRRAKEPAPGHPHATWHTSERRGLAVMVGDMARESLGTARAPAAGCKDRGRDLDGCQRQHRREPRQPAGKSAAASPEHQHPHRRRGRAGLRRCVQYAMAGRPRQERCGSGIISSGIWERCCATPSASANPRLTRVALTASSMVLSGRRCAAHCEQKRVTLPQRQVFD